MNKYRVYWSFNHTNVVTNCNSIVVGGYNKKDACSKAAQSIGNHLARIVKVELIGKIPLTFY